jgi:hypothetical protein
VPTGTRPIKLKTPRFVRFCLRTERGVPLSAEEHFDFKAADEYCNPEFSVL